MRRSNPTYHIFCFLLVSCFAYGQISPGKLSQAHSDLEGISNCTQCHELGNKVSDTKCLDCHKEIKTLINQKRGYHTDYEVSSKDCFECHSEHHGLKFDMLHFDEDEFDHDLAGYTLSEQHLVIDCKECHKPDYIADNEISQREGTYLGLEQECLSCHDDFHQGTLSEDCVSCHNNFQSFRPADGFNHDETAFVLKGEHLNTECISCHEVTNLNGAEYQVFNDLEFNDCVSCHEDPHLGKINATCSSCHDESSFSIFLGAKSFNHQTTKFNLNGKHKSLDCFSCHDKTNNPALIFQDQLGVNENNCVQCHDDIHIGKFGTDCAKCHMENGFTDLRTMEFFDHTLTDYPLEGNHVNLECGKCHEESYLEPIDFMECKNCHEDYHNGEFSENGLVKDCKECHSLNEGFEYSLFTIEDHEEGNFPLDGSHLATPCFLCHVSEDKWIFRNIGSECIDCHDDIHEGFISQNYYPEQDCKTCHITEAWSLIAFDHNETEWALEGKHKETECRDCHFVMDDNNSNFNQRFEALESTCITCHENVHDNQFEENGVTDCKTCHDSKNWNPSLFDHNTTAFILDGKHTDLECNACHKPTKVEGETKTYYKIEKFECVDCHS